MCYKFLYDMGTTLLGVITGGFITLKVNNYHERKKLIVEQKLKLWELISSMFEDLDNDIFDIRNALSGLIINDENFVIDIKGRLKNIQIDINKVENKLNKYDIILENVDYLGDVKHKLDGMYWCILNSNKDTIELNEFEECLEKFNHEFMKLRKNIQVELLNVLYDKKIISKKIKNLKKHVNKRYFIMVKEYFKKIIKFKS